MFLVEAHRRSAKHQRYSFHETGSGQTFIKYAVPDFADQLLFVSFQQISNAVYEYASHSAFQLKTQKIHRSK